MALTKDQILACNDLKKELVPVPEWGGEVWVRGMTGAERDAFEMGIVETRGKKIVTDRKNIRAKLCAKSICDENGKLLFSESEITALGDKNAAALQRVFMAAQRLSGITEGDVEELTGELETNPFEDSPSD